MSLTPGELEDAQADAEALLPEVGRVLIQSATPDGAGGQDETFTPGDDIPCRVAPLSQKSGLTGERGGSAGARIDDRTTHFITLPAGTVISEADRVEIDDRGVFEVTAVMRTSYEFTKRVEAKEAF